MYMDTLRRKRSAAAHATTRAAPCRAAGARRGGAIVLNRGASRHRGSGVAQRASRTEEIEQARASHVAFAFRSSFSSSACFWASASCTSWFMIVVRCSWRAPSCVSHSLASLCAAHAVEEHEGLAEPVCHGLQLQGEELSRDAQHLRAETGTSNERRGWGEGASNTVVSVRTTLARAAARLA